MQLLLAASPVHMQDFVVIADVDYVRNAVDVVRGGVPLAQVVGEGEVERGRRAGDGAKCLRGSVLMAMTCALPLVGI